METKKEDTMNIKDFIGRFESACTAMVIVNEEEKCNLFWSYLRGKAMALWINPAYHSITVNNWRILKESQNCFRRKLKQSLDFAERCVMEMREFIKSIDGLADDQYDTSLIPQPRKPSTETQNVEWSSTPLPKDTFWWELIKPSKSCWWRLSQWHSPKPSEMPWSWNWSMRPTVPGLKKGLWIRSKSNV